jgi:hypothetical protein
MKTLFIPVLFVFLSVMILGGCGFSSGDDRSYGVAIGGKVFQVELADTPDKREAGLSGREGLDDNEGMLFIYNRPQRPSFWMKDMLFPLDIVWIKNKKVIGVEKNIQPQDLQPPDVLTPETEVDMVLELNAGAIEKDGIKMEDEISFQDI